MFRFRLERILLHRQRQVDTRTREAALATTRLQAAQMAAARIACELECSWRQAAEDSRRGTDAVALGRQLAWHEALCARSRELEEAVEHARAELASAQQCLQEAWQAREVLQRLKERQRQQWASEAARRERRTMDEISSIKAALRVLEVTGGRQDACRRNGGPSSESGGI